MIYVDSSVILAELLVEDRRPPASVTEAPLCSSRLIEYEIWNRVNSRGMAQSRSEDVQQILAKISFVELSPFVLARALEPFPVSVRTLDGLHLSSISFLRDQRTEVEVATYDQRFAKAARAMGFDIREI